MTPTLISRWGTLAVATFLGWGGPAVAEEAWADTAWRGVALGGALYTVNYIHEGGHWLAGEWLGYDVDMQIHPFSGHAEVSHKRKRVKPHDEGRIAIAGPLVTRGVYELANSWLLTRPQDGASPYLGWAALGLRLDLPFQQGKAIVNHWRGDHHDDDDDIAKFYETLPGGHREVRAYHLLGAVLSAWDLSTDASDLMYHLSLGAGEPVASRQEPRWQFGLNGMGAFLGWSADF